MEYIGVVAFFAVLIALWLVFEFLWKKVFAYWLDHKFGPGSADRYRKAPKSSWEENGQFLPGFLLALAIFMIPCGFLPFILPDAFGAGIIGAEVIVWIIDIFLVIGVIAPFRNARKWFSAHETEQTAVNQKMDAEKTLRDASRIPIIARIFIAIFAFLATVIIIVIPLIGFELDGGLFIVVLAGIVCVLAFLRVSPCGMMYAHKRNISKFADPQAVFAELSEQGESVPGIEPYLLRISPNYIMLCCGRWYNYVWKRSELSCRDKAEKDEYGQVKLMLTVAGKRKTVAVHQAIADTIAHAISSACEDTCRTPEERNSIALANFNDVFAETLSAADSALDDKVYSLRKAFGFAGPEYDDILIKTGDALFRLLKASPEEIEDLHKDTLKIDKVIEKLEETDPVLARTIKGLSALDSGISVVKTVGLNGRQSVLDFFVQLYRAEPDVTDCDALVRFIKMTDLLKTECEENMDLIPLELRDSMNLGVREHIVPFLKKYGLM